MGEGWDIYSWPVFRFPTSRRRRKWASRCIRQNMFRFASRPDTTRRVLVLMLFGWMLAAATTYGIAHAEVDGSVPGPGLCSYPGVGSSGMDFGVYHYVCDFPIEINGSHWHCEYGGAAGNGLVGVSIAPFGVGLNAAVSSNVGVLEGSCSWRCPDNNLAAAPNPPLAWQNGQAMTARCKDVAPAPVPAWLAQPPGPPNPLAPQGESP